PEHHQHRFLALREHFLQVLLRRRERGLGLFTGFAQDGELCGDLLGGGVFVIQDVAQLAQRGLDGAGVGGGAVAAAVVVVASTETAAAAARVTPRVHHLGQLGLDDLPLFVGGAHLLLDLALEPFASAGGVEASARPAATAV